MTGADPRIDGIGGRPLTDAPTAGEHPGETVGASSVDADQEPTQPRSLTSLTSLLGGTIDGGAACSVEGACD